MEKLTKFQNQKRPKEGSQYISLSVILIDSVFQTSKNHYPQVFLEERKDVVKKKKMPKYIPDDVEISDEEDSKKKFWWGKL